MLGRGAGLTEAQIRHLVCDPLPQGVYEAAESAIVRYARAATRMQPIDAALYRELERHFVPAQLVDLCLTVGLSNVVNRFHATFLTDLDPRISEDAEAGDREAGACPVPRPLPPRRTS